MYCFSVENSFYVVNFQKLKCYNFRPDENIRLFREAVVLKNILSTLSNILDVKFNNIYEVFIKANESTMCLWTEWVQHVGLALQNCSTVSEKIKILTLLPSSLKKNVTSSLFPDIYNKIHNRKSEKSCTRKRRFSELEADTGHPIDKKTEKLVIGY